MQMQGVKLNIEQQRAEIDVEIQNAQLHVKVPRREMVIKHEPAQMKITRREGDVALDFRSTKSNLGLKSFAETTRRAAERAAATAQRSIKESVGVGEALGDPSKGVSVGKIYRDKVLTAPQPKSERSPVPPQVDMDGKPGKMEVKWERGGITIDWEGENLVEVYVEPPHSVRVQLVQRPDVQITLMEEELPEVAGRVVDGKV
jgi:hypothetical protein